MEMIDKLVVASNNAGKVKEIREILGLLDLEVVGLSELGQFESPEEVGETFLENALIKAKTAHEATGLFALADDSGIEVDALNGAPGVYSARYGGSGLSDEERYLRLLDELKGVPESKRGARFHCTMVLYPRPGSDSDFVATEGYLYGRIATIPVGTNGFGYDPVFYIPELGKTVAELSSDEKNRISHRYRALVEMKWLLVNRFGVSLKRP